MITLSDAAVSVLLAAEPAEKCRLTRLYAQLWAEGGLRETGTATPPDRPARPATPVLRPPREMPKRSYGGRAGKVALLHALAHIELNAIDLAWDVLCRFPHEHMPEDFLSDWVQVALDEVLHFEALEALMRPLGAAYGDLPAHDGLWQAAEKTADDLMARLAVVPMTLEARGCDTTPATIAKLERGGDPSMTPALQTILNDEIRHVAAGLRGFRLLADRRGEDPGCAYRRVMAERFPFPLKPPFNHEARAEAGFERDWYEPLALG